MLKNEPATYKQWQVKIENIEATVKSEALIERVSLFIDPKPDDLAMARVKLR